MCSYGTDLIHKYALHSYRADCQFPVDMYDILRKTLEHVSWSAKVRSFTSKSVLPRK